MLLNRSVLLVPLVLGCTVALAACSGGGPSPDPTATRTVTAAPSDAAATVTPTATATATDTATAEPSSGSTPSSSATAARSCGSSDVRSVVAAAVAELPSPGIGDARWDATYAGTSLYQPCAALSAVTVPITGATGSSPVAIMLFHDGRYLGTATKEQYAFQPDLARDSDSTIAVTYHFAKPDETTAGNSGRTQATFTWDDRAGRVVMRGQVPPRL